MVLVNTDIEKENSITLEQSAIRNPQSAIELLGQSLPKISSEKDKTVFTLAPGAAFCLAPTENPAGLSGDDYRRARAQAAWALESLNKIVPTETIDGLDWRWLAEQAGRSPKNFLAAAGEFAARDAKTPLADLLSEVESGKVFPRVVEWTLIDRRRVTLVPPGHWLLVQDTAPFRATLEMQNAECGMKNGNAGAIHVQSIPAGNIQIACFAPREASGEAQLVLERYASTSQKISAAICFLFPTPHSTLRTPHSNDLVLLTNGLGGMVRLCVDLGRINSKYDCALGANLNPDFPVDRHIFIKRLRAWVNADGFLSPLDFKTLAAFHAGSPAVWQFVASAGDGRTVEIELRAEMVEGKNTTVFQFSRPTDKRASGKQLPANADVRLTVRFDIEDRNFHSETKRNGGADFHFSSNARPLVKQIGFEFTPASDRQLRVFADAGEYHPQPEWCENIPHPVEQSRGQTGSGDAYSPGWFELPLAKGANITLVATAENCVDSFEAPPSGSPDRLKPELLTFESQLERAAKQFVVRRGAGKTVIAGYPWFLDWGRDSLICARGLLAAGMTEDVKQLLLTFAQFEKDGTLPNTIHGSDVSNRDTTDAPLWFAVVCEDLADKKFFEREGGQQPDNPRRADEHRGKLFQRHAQRHPHGRGLGAHLESEPFHLDGHELSRRHAARRLSGRDSSAVDSPAAAARENFRARRTEKMARTCRPCDRFVRTNCSGSKKRAGLPTCCWADSASSRATPRRTTRSAAMVCSPSASVSSPANARNASSPPRKNISSCRARCDRSRRCRCLCRLPIYRDGQLLNNPAEPYWPRYEGDEDTRRKPAYHNGTAWTWTFPVFCEALARAWNFTPEAVAAAKSYLGSAEKIVERRLSRPDSGNSRRRRAAHATRLRRAGVGRHGNASRVEASVNVNGFSKNHFAVSGSGSR